MHLVESLLTGDHHWYYSPLKTTIDRASMACEDMGTRLMTLDEVLEIRNSIPENNIARSFVWALNPVTNAPLAVKMRTEEHSTSMLSASILCKSSSEYSYGVFHFASFRCLASEEAQEQVYALKSFSFSMCMFGPNCLSMGVYCLLRIQNRMPACQVRLECYLHINLQHCYIHVSALSQICFCCKCKLSTCRTLFLLW